MAQGDVILCWEANGARMGLQHHVAIMQCHLSHQSDGDECSSKVEGLEWQIE